MKDMTRNLYDGNLTKKSHSNHSAVVTKNFESSPAVDGNVKQNSEPNH